MTQKVASSLIAELPVKEQVSRKHAVCVQHAGRVVTEAEHAAFLDELFHDTPGAPPHSERRTAAGGHHHHARAQVAPFASLTAAILQLDSSTGKAPGHFVQHILPRMVNHVLNFELFLPERLPILSELPHPASSANATATTTVAISRRQCFAILSAAFLCAFPRSDHGSDGRMLEMPGINYHRMFHCPAHYAETQKLVMHFDYFTAIACQLLDNDSDAYVPLIDDPSNGLILARMVVPSSSLKSEALTCQLIPLEVHPLKAGIDEQMALLRVDFANKYIGGGSLSQGCVQEEITFSICPECNVSRYICEKIADHEAILLLNAKVYSSIVPGSYGWTMKRLAAVDAALTPTPNVIVAVDAVPFQRGDPSQFQPQSIQRELVKALAGFQALPLAVLHWAPTLAEHSSLLSGIATGTWGCGAFNGDVELKALIQWIAASVSGRTMHYFPFDNEKVLQILPRLAAGLVAQKVTAGALLACLTREACHWVQQGMHLGRGSGIFDLVSEIFGI